MENKGIFGETEKTWIDAFEAVTEIECIRQKINGKKVELNGI